MIGLYEAMELLKQVYLHEVQDIIKTQNTIIKPCEITEEAEAKPEELKYGKSGRS